VVFEITHFTSFSVFIATSISFCLRLLASVVLAVPNLTRYNNGRCQVPIWHKGAIVSVLLYYMLKVVIALDVTSCGTSTAAPATISHQACYRWLRLRSLEQKQSSIY
jgi:hypothetical protein